MQRLKRFISTLIVVCALAPATSLADEAKTFGFLEDFGLTTSVAGTSGIDEVNPLLDVGLSLRPSYALTKNLKARARLDLFKEFTNSDANSDDKELLFTDLYLQLSHNQLAMLGPVKLGGLGRLYLPTSENSRLAGLNASARVGLNATYVLGILTTQVVAQAQKYFYEFTTASTADCGKPARRTTRFVTGGGGVFDSVSACNTGRQLNSFLMLFAFVAELQLTSKLTLGAEYDVLDTFAHDTRPATCEELGAIGCAEGESFGHDPELSSHRRFNQAASLALGYAYTDAISIALSVANGPMPQRRLNGKDHYNPFLLWRNGQNFTTVALELAYAL